VPNTSTAATAMNGVLLPLSDFVLVFGESSVAKGELPNAGAELLATAVDGISIFSARAASTTGNSTGEAATGSFAGAGAAAAPCPTDFGARNGRGVPAGIDGLGGVGLSKLGEVGATGPAFGVEIGITTGDLAAGVDTSRAWTQGLVLPAELCCPTTRALQYRSHRAQ